MGPGSPAVATSQPAQIADNAATEPTGCFSTTDRWPAGRWTTRPVMRFPSSAK